MAGASSVAALLPPGTVTYAIAKAVPGAATFATVILLIRLAGPTNYGIYSISLAAAVFACSLSTGWLLQASLRFAGDDAAPWYAMRPWAPVTSFLCAALVTCVLLAVLSGGISLSATLAAAALAGVLAAQGLVVTQLQSDLAPGKVLVAESLRASLQLCLPVVLLLTFPKTGTTVIVAMTLAVAIAVAPFLRRLIPRPASTAPVTKVQREHTLVAWWRYGWPMSIWLSMAAILQFSDRLLIERWHGPSSAGTYAGLYDVLNGGLAICLFPVTMAAFPRISRAWNAGRRADALKQNARALRAQLLLFLPVLAVAFLARGTLVGVVLGRSATPTSVHIVLPLLLGAFCWQWALGVHKRLELERRTRTMLLFVVISAAVNFGLNVLTIPSYGGLAAAWTTLAGAAVYLCLCATWRMRRPAAREAAGLPCRERP